MEIRFHLTSSAGVKANRILQARATAEAVGAGILVVVCAIVVLVFAWFFGGVHP